MCVEDFVTSPKNRIELVFTTLKRIFLTVRKKKICKYSIHITRYF